MSHEAIAWARRAGATGDFAQKWLTVPSDDPEAARAAFRALGYQTRGLTVLSQSEATEAAERITEESR